MDQQIRSKLDKYFWLVPADWSQAVEDWKKEAKKAAPKAVAKAASASSSASSSKDGPKSDKAHEAAMDMFK